MKLNRQKTDVKKHIKFDDSNFGLFVQLKHICDDEWTNFSFEQAKEHQEKSNASRAKKSFLFKSPERSEDAMRDKLPPSKSAAGSSSFAAAAPTGTFVPTTRKQPGQRDRVPWTPAEREKEKDQLMT